MAFHHKMITAYFRGKERNTETGIDADGALNTDSSHRSSHYSHFIIFIEEYFII